MRSVLVAACLLLLMPVLGAGAVGTGELRDDFGNVSYSGSDGNIDWASSWVEGGEIDGPSEGALHIGAENCSNNKCLHMEGGLIGPSLSISRKADLSDFATAELSYDVFIDPILLSTARLVVEVRGADSGWTEVDSYQLASQGGEHSASIDVTPFSGSDFEIRFGLFGLTGGDLVTVDRVVIEGPLHQVTTTSSSTTTTRPSTTTSPPSTTTSGNATTSSSTTTTVPATTTTSIAPTTSEGSSGPGERAGVGDPDLSTTTTTNPTGDGEVSRPTAVGVIGGLRDPGVGLLADYRGGLMGGIDYGEIEVLGAEIDADFSMVVEVFEAAQLWVAALGLVLAAALIGVLDRRRSLDRDRLA